MSGKNLEFEVIFSPKAIKQLKHLEKDVQLRIKSAIENSLRSFPLQGDIIKLEGYKGRYRLREVHIAEIKHRREAYRK